MAFPFYKSIDSYIVSELRARSSNSNVQLSKLMPWIKATTSLEGRYSIGTDSYSTLFGGGSTDSYTTTSQWKYRPNPIITDFSVDFASRGTLRRCTLKIKCFTPDQLRLIQQNFLEPGISVYVQWGWNYSVEKNKAIGPTDVSAGTVQKYNRNAAELNNIRAANYGCYDNFVGIIGGGESVVAGIEFDVNVKMVSLGEILMGKSGETVVPDAEAEKIKPLSHPNSKAALEQNRNRKLNWVYCFDQLPDELRNNNTLKIEDTFKYDSDFINYNESLVTEAKEETSEGWFSGDLTFKGKSFEAADADNPINGGKFMSFDAFIKLLNAARIKLIANNTVDFAIDISNTYIGSFSRIFSTDERIYIPNSTCYNYLDDIILLNPSGVSSNTALDTSVNGRSFPKNGATTVTFEGQSVTLPAGKHGWIGDVYIENEMAMEALKNQTTPIKEVLDGVLKKMEDAVEGLWSFQILEDKSGDATKLRIADANLRNVRSGNNGSNVQEFEMFGTNSFFLDANFNLDIPKEMASKVYMEKSVDSVQSPDELTGLFSSKKDVVLGKLNKEAYDATIVKPEEEDPKQKWIEFRRNIKLLVNPNIISVADIGDGNMDEWAICGNYLNKRKFNDIRKQDLGYTGGGEVYNGRSLPVGFDFTVLGMSGFQVGHLFSIKGLPDQYSINRGAFQIEEITHKIDGKQWITEVKSHFRPFYK